MKEKPSNPVKKRISEVIKPRGLKAKLAKLLGYSRASVSDMLISRGDPPIHYVKAVSELTGKSIDWLLHGENQEGKIYALEEPMTTYEEVRKLKEENQRLKTEIEVLRSALREIGAGSKGKK
jgi:hypothetical protein